MLKYKYNDRVLVVNDSSDGFFIGLEGIVRSYSKDEKGEVTYMLDVGRNERPFYFKEQDLQKL